MSQQPCSHSSSQPQHFPRSCASEVTNAMGPSLWHRLHPTPDASAASALGTREETAISPHVTHLTNTKLQLLAWIILAVFSNFTDSIKGE